MQHRLFQNSAFGVVHIVEHHWMKTCFNTVIVSFLAFSLPLNMEKGHLSHYTQNAINQDVKYCFIAKQRSNITYKKRKKT